MKKVKKISISIGLWLSFCILSLTFTAHVNAAESDIIYEYKTITQKKGEAFSSVLHKAGLSDAEKKLVYDMPIFHQAPSERQIRLTYRIENGKKTLISARLKRENRLASFVLSKKDGKDVFILESAKKITSQRIRLESAKKITSQRISSDEPIPKTQTKTIKLKSKQEKDSPSGPTDTKNDKNKNIAAKPTQKTLESSIPNSLIGVSVSQAKGQSLDAALSVAKLSQLQEKIIKSGNYLKIARSQRTFNIYFQTNGERRLLKGLRIHRGQASVDFIVKKESGRFQLVSLKLLDSNARSQWQKVFDSTKVRQIKSVVVKTTSASAVQENISKHNNPPSVQKSNGKYQVIDITQKKGQILYSALKTAKLTSTQRNLVIAMPATKSAKTTRKIYVLLENHYLRGLRIVRGKNIAEYVLFKHKGKWKWANKKGEISTQNGGSFARYPLSFLRVSSPFSLRRRHPITGRIRPHKGIDLAAPHGTPIYAPASGVVTFSGRQRGYGIVLEIDHKNSYKTKYGHLSRIMRSARKGRYVKKGQLIARVGNTGLSTGAHLHYEVIVNGRHRNPATVRLPGGRAGGRKVIPEAKKAVQHYLPILRRLSK